MELPGVGSTAASTAASEPTAGKDGRAVLLSDVGHHALGHVAGAGDGPPRASVEVTPPSREDGESLTGATGSHDAAATGGHDRQVPEDVVKGTIPP